MRGDRRPDGPVKIGAPEPYRSTPIFDETTLPAGLRREHRTKVGVWGVIRVLEGWLHYRVLDPVSELSSTPSIRGSSFRTSPIWLNRFAPSAWSSNSTIRSHS
ncbi:DUF1971 domain-containing protein [Sphingopyxis sp. Root214]|uniref:DUF1971 domain-containing protein n=2 Tax=unclassified Sphingopyxis TaxID=2614943 RepID=UPI003FA72932